MIGFGLGLHRLRSTVAQVRDRSFPYLHHPPRRRNWQLYDLAQTHELEGALHLIPLVVDTDTAERGGIPPTDGRDGPAWPYPIG